MLKRVRPCCAPAVHSMKRTSEQSANGCGVPSTLFWNLLMLSTVQTLCARNYVSSNTKMLQAFKIAILHTATQASYFRSMDTILVAFSVECCARHWYTRIATSNPPLLRKQSFSSSCMPFWFQQPNSGYNVKVQIIRDVQHKQYCNCFICCHSGSWEQQTGMIVAMNWRDYAVIFLCFYTL